MSSEKWLVLKRLEIKQITTFYGLPFNILALIFSHFNSNYAFSVLSKVCKEWKDVIDQVFLFSPNTYSPYGLSIKKHFLGLDWEGGRHTGHFDWNRIVLNLTGLLTKAYPDLVFPFVVRIIENRRMFGLQTKVKSFADQFGVTGYIQSQSVYEGEELGVPNSPHPKRMLDICCQGSPSLLQAFVSQLAGLQNTYGESIILPCDVNIIGRSRMSKVFKIKKTEAREAGENSDSDDDSSASISTVTIHTTTANKKSLEKLKVFFKKKNIIWFLFLVEELSSCPDIIIQVLNLFHLLKYREVISVLLSEMSLETSKIDDPNEQPMEPIWKACVEKCFKFLENCEGARNIVHFSYARIR